MDKVDNDLAVDKYFFNCLPVSKKVSKEELYRNKGHTIIRQYSCEYIYDQPKETTAEFKTINTYNPNKIEITSAAAKPPAISKSHPKALNIFKTKEISEQFQFFKFCSEQEGFENILTYCKMEENEPESTPMEVDTSTELEQSMTDVHSISQLNIDTTKQLNKVPKLSVSTKLKSKKRKIKNKRPKHSTTSCSIKIIKFLKSIAVYIVPMLIGFMLIYYDVLSTPYNTSKRIDVDGICTALEQSLYGQEAAILKIKEYLNNRNQKELFIFTGGVGVGKTHTANVISDNFQWHNIHKIISPRYKNTDDMNTIIKQLSRTGFNLVIVDTLNVGDEKYIIPFVTELMKSDTNVVVLLIFTIQEYVPAIPKMSNLVTNSIVLSDIFSEASLMNNLIIFNYLNKEDVKKCILYNLSKKGMHINDHNIETVFQNIDYNYTGCKMVYSKVSILK